MNKNTKIRIRVPKSLYESIQQEIKKESTKQEEFGQYHGKQAMKPGIQMEEEEQMNEADVQGYIDAIATAVDPETLMWLAGVIGTTGAGAWIGKKLQQRADSGEGNPTLDKTMRTNEVKKHKPEEDIKEYSMEKLSEAIKKVMENKKKKAAAAKEKEKEKETAAKEKEKEAMAKKKAAAAKKK
jgi:hypothetical protein